MVAKPNLSGKTIADHIAIHDAKLKKLAIQHGDKKLALANAIAPHVKFSAVDLIQQPYWVLNKLANKHGIYLEAE